MSYSLENQTNLIPKQLYGISSSGDVDISITSAGIVLGGDLTTTPIYATVNQSGLSTTNPNGLQVLSKLNLNSNNIDSVGTITATSFSGTATLATTIKTTNTTANATHYLNFSDSSSTGNGSVQKTAGINCNPSTNTVTATSFVGNLTGTASSATNSTNAINTSTTLTTTSGTYYPVFVSSNTSGNYPNLVGTMTYNPSTNAVTANTFNGALSGTATNSTNVAITDDNTNATFYPVFVSNNTGNLPLKVDKTTNPLSYNPSTGVLSAISYAGSGANLTGITATNATNATNVGITDTTTTAGTYYPTFVSANTGNVGMRTDSQYLIYNPSTNIFQNPNFLVSNGTETSTNGGLLISTSGIGSKSIYSTTTTGSTNNALTIQTTNNGNASSGIYETRQSGSGNGSGSGITAFPLWSLQSSSPTPASVGIPSSSGNYYMLGSCCNMGTQLTPNGSENGVVVGFQNSIGDNNGYADMFYNNDQYTTTSPYILRLDGNGNLKYGIGTAGTYSFGTPNPTALSSTYFSVDNTGVATTNSLTLSNAPTTINQASRLGQVGLVKIGSVSVAITGSASAQNLSFANLFNSSYKNYRIILEPTTQVSFVSYPSYALQAFLGSGTLPTTASLFGFEMISSATSVVSPVYTAGATISSAPLVFAVSSLTNKEIIFDIQNVGYANTSTQQVSLMCKSLYGNPAVSGASDRTITCSSISGATITGLVIQQSTLSVGNNFTLRAVVYGYNQL
jgi:hypothetical protein